MDKDKIRNVLERVAIGAIKSGDAAKELGLGNSRFHEIKRAYGIKRPPGMMKVAKQKAEQNRLEREHVARLVHEGKITFRQGLDQLGVGENTLRRWIAKVSAEEKTSESSGS